MRLFIAMLVAAAGLRASPAPELFIDPGHGGGDAGVHEGSLNEAEVVFDVASQLQALLKARGMESVLSRDPSSSPAASARVAAANASGAKAFLSLHINHSPSPSVRGPRIFIPKSLVPEPSYAPRRWEKAAGEHADEAKVLALYLAKSLGTAESAKTGVQSINLVAFKGLAMPGVLVELGFLSHAESRQRFADPQYRSEVAGRLAEALLSWKARGTNP